MAELNTSATLHSLDTPSHIATDYTHALQLLFAEYQNSILFTIQLQSILVGHLHSSTMHPQCICMYTYVTAFNTSFSRVLSVTSV